jgi:hypothetical protein
MLRWMKLCGCVVLAMLSVSLASTAQSTAGCTLERGIYTCDWKSFRAALDSARTVRIEAQRLDRPAAAQLRHLAASLGKSVVSDGEPADLIFLLIPIEPPAISMGPGTRDLATLRIYASAPDGSRGALLWAETYRGQPDLPSPTAADQVIEQFKARLK